MAAFGCGSGSRRIRKPLTSPTMPASRYRVGTVATTPALVVGYGNLVDARLDEAVARLAAAVAEAT